jgi:fused signal recognition particle receptor
MLRGLFRNLGATLSGRKLDEELLEEWEEQLVMGDVSIDTTQFIIEQLRDAARRGAAPTDEAAQNALQQIVCDVLDGEGEREGQTQLRFAESGPTVWLFVGVNGVGKTTSIGKLAYRFAREGRKPLLVAGDTFRAAAIEQLQEWGRRADVPVIAQQHGADPAAVVYDGVAAARSRDRDLVMIDTAGRLHTKSNLMNELAKIARVVERETGKPPEETLLVIDASTGQNGLSQARTFAGSAPLTGLILTKWDGTAKGGIVLTIAHETGLPVKQLGVGEKVDDLCDFDAKEWTNTMFSAS